VCSWDAILGGESLLTNGRKSWRSSLGSFATLTSHARPTPGCGHDGWLTAARYRLAEVPAITESWPERGW
jgi:hypothetical protein